jgi:hypothetical protein
MVPYGKRRLLGKQWDKLYGRNAKRQVNVNCPIVIETSTATPQKNVSFTISGFNFLPVTSIIVGVSTNCVFTKTSTILTVTIPNSFTLTSGPYILKISSSVCDTPVEVTLTNILP